MGRSTHTPRPAARYAVVATLALLYVAQGIPFGFASEYLPVVLRQAGYTRTQIALLFWLQLPWQLKIFWARAADHPAIRPRSRAVLLALQLALAGAVAAYAPFDVRTAAGVWFALTALCALVAATQDVFVDALAVRSLLPRDRGFGNVAQVAGYRLGMLTGGAGLLLLVASLGQRLTLLLCAGVVAIASVGAFVLRDAGRPSDAGAPGPDAPYRAPAEDAGPRAAPMSLAGVLRHVASPGCWPVLALAASFKLGPHVASTLIKPMAVDAGWTPRQIGLAAVTVGTASGLAGAAVGGWLYRALRDRRALAFAAVAQGVACAPLVAAAVLRAPYGFTTFAIAAEHLASGLGTTVLFAALMTATRPSSAGVHYTVLTSANTIAIALGGLLGAAMGDRLGEPAAFTAAAALCLAPLALLRRWDDAAARSAAE